MALDDPRPDERQEERPDERPEDREDDTDRAIKLARGHVIEAVEFLVRVMREGHRLGPATTDVQVRAVTTLLEVAGCL